MNRNSDKIADEYLVVRCQRGDGEALSTLINRCQAAFISYASIVTRDRELARDVVQDGWLKIIGKLSGLKDPASFHAWAYRIINNLSIDALRRQRPTGDSELTDTITPLKAIEDQDQVNTLLKRLSTEHRSVLALHYLLGFEINEIASVLSCPAGTVKSRLFNAREHFRQLMKDHDGEQHERPGQQDQADAQPGSRSIGLSS